MQGVEDMKYSLSGRMAILRGMIFPVRSSRPGFTEAVARTSCRVDKHIGRPSAIPRSKSTPSRLRRWASVKPALLKSRRIAMRP